MLIQIFITIRFRWQENTKLNDFYANLMSRIKFLQIICQKTIWFQIILSGTLDFKSDNKIPLLVQPCSTSNWIFVEVIPFKIYKYNNPHYNCNKSIFVEIYNIKVKDLLI